MTTRAETTEAASRAEQPLTGGLLARAERVLEWAGDRLNPILVKETRQALKSRQFVITFLLLLICGWGWSILGVALIGPNVWTGTSGSFMFYGYYVILAFPLIVIVPFGAFRSLAGEQEDRTYELMSITALGPRQIVSGKLGSAVLQMLIYLSAIAPCVAFSYMLRGIDLPMILFILFYTVLASLALATVGLLVGTATSEKHWQVVLSVFLIAGLLAALWAALLMTMVLMQELSREFSEIEFWQVNAAILTGYASYVVLLFYAAAAQITFPSDNRSTRLRIVMVVQQLLLTGWIAWLWLLFEDDDEVAMVFMIPLALHWYAMGAFMTSESPDLSPRVKRQLPQSFLGRVFLTWFNPGPGTGYVLAIASLLGGLGMVTLGLVAIKGFSIHGISLRPLVDGAPMLAFGLLATCYVALYLGLGLLLIRLLGRFVRVHILLGVLVQILLLALGFFVPLVIHLMSPALRDDPYNLLHVLSPYSLGFVFRGNNLTPEGFVMLAVVPLAALAVFVLNLPGVAREVRQVRIAKPRRVAEEDAQRAAEKAPPEPAQISPWD